MAPFNLVGTTPLVTGASSGLGAEFARQLAARGSNLVLVARSGDRLATLAEDLQAQHRVAVTTVPADLSLADQVSLVAAHAAATGIDVLVNNAGFGTYGEFADLDPGREHAEMMVNVVAAVDLAHAVLPGMLARRRGGIITVASSVAFQPSPQQAVYGATKAFALVGRPIITAGTGRGSVAMARSPSVISGCDVDLDVSGSKPENLLMEAHWPGIRGGQTSILTMSGRSSRATAAGRAAGRSGLDVLQVF